MNKNFSWFGVDFGTTNSSMVSFTGTNNDNLRQIQYGDDEGRPFPSIVAINKDNGEIIVGREAKEGKNFLETKYEFFPSVKTILSDRKEWIVGGKKWTPVDIATEVLKALKLRVEHDGIQKVDSAVFAVPIGFNHLKKKQLRTAARNAGMEIEMFISEPTAAFCSNYSKLKSCKNVAVFDWGGGTLDVAVLHVADEKIYELATNGLDFAGNGMDVLFAQKMHSIFTRGKQPVMSFEELDPLTKDQLILKCEKAKCDFSVEDLVSISINKYSDYGSVRDTVDYEYFSLLLAPVVDNAIDCLNKTIKEAGLNKQTLDCILVVGGSGQLRLLREKLINTFGEEILYFPESVMWDIARGAAIISTKPGQFALNKSIGMILSDGSYYPLFEKGQKIPCKEKTIKLGMVEGSEDGIKEAMFIFTDSEKESDRSFIKKFSMPTRGFVDEYLILSCYIDPDFIFKLKIATNKMHEEASRVWNYDKLKMYYEIEG